MRKMKKINKLTVDRFKKFREALFLSQEEIAIKLGKKKYNVSDIEGGRSSLKINDLIKLRDVCGLDVNGFIDDILIELRKRG